MSNQPAVRKAASEAAARLGMGPRASPLVAGHTARHTELECALARLKGAEAGLLFPTGFAANVAVMSTLAQGGDVALFSDELNHASIIDGIRLAARGQRQRSSRLMHPARSSCHATAKMDRDAALFDEDRAWCAMTAAVCSRLPGWVTRETQAAEGL